MAGQPNAMALHSVAPRSRQAWRYWATDGSSEASRKTLPTRLRSHIHSVTCAQLLLSKSLSSQLVLLQLHSGQMLLEHVRREPPNRRE